MVLAITLPCVLLGFVLARRSLPARLNPGSPGLAALAAYALYMAPVALTGHWTWPGYNFVNDTAPNFIYADLLSRQGMTLPAAIDSTTAVIQAAPINLGYPVGAHGLLATVQPLTGADLPAVYHPIIAAIAGLAAMAMAQLARRAGLAPLPAAVAGVLPVGAVLLYRYGLHGSIKEELVVALMAAAAALAREALDRELSIRFAVLIALCAAALLHVFSAVGAAYALVLGVLLLAVALVEGRGVVAIGRLAAAGVAIGVLAVAVNLSDVTSFAKHAGDTFASEGGASTAYLGHLIRALPLVEASGRLVLARLSRRPCRLSTSSQNTVGDRRGRSARNRGHRAGAAPEAARRAVAPDSDGGGGAPCWPPSCRPTRRQAPRRSVACRGPHGRRSAASRCWRSECAGCRCWPGSAWRS